MRKLRRFFGLASDIRLQGNAIGNFLPVALLLVLVTCSGVYGQAVPPAPPPEPAEKAKTLSKDPLNRDTPQSAATAFLEAYHAKNYERATKYLDLRKLSQADRSKNGVELAQQLGQILDRDAQFDVAVLSHNPEGEPEDGLPPNCERVASFNVSGKKVDLLLERVTLRPGHSIWRFSSGSVALIPQLVRVTSDSPVEKHLPDPLVTWKIADTPLWRVIALLLLAVVVAAFSRLFSRGAICLLEPALKRVAPRMDWSVLDAFIAPVALLLAVAGFRAGMEWIGPSAKLRPFLENTVSLFFFVALSWISAKIVDLISRHVRGLLQAKHASFSFSVLPLLGRVLKIVIALFMIAAVLSSWGYNTTTILAGLGVGGIAIALAAQKTIENLFGGVSVISDRPVTVGDTCKFGDRVGTVEDIGLRSTRLRTPERTLVTVPNGQFASMTLENLSKQDKMLFHFMLNLRRDTTPDQVRAVLSSIAKILTDREKVEAGNLPVRFVGVGTYSLDLEVAVYILTRSGDEFLQIQQELLLRILDAIQAAGTALALPTQASVSYAAAESAQPQPVTNGRGGGGNGRNGG
ncbi:MAG TPA: mechanosensitive ion channel family protein [Bryobacteraceae bacterium]|nr:mechanosensitive ion channel family protein [Bryobacteraceae bacterium]